MNDTATARRTDRPDGFGNALAFAETLAPAAAPTSPVDDLDREFLELVAAAELLALMAADNDDPEQAASSLPSRPVDPLPTTAHAAGKPVEPAPWMGGTLLDVAEIAALCGGVVSDELLHPDDRGRVFNRRLARAGQLAAYSFTSGRLEAFAIG